VLISSVPDGAGGLDEVYVCIDCKTRSIVHHDAN